MIRWQIGHYTITIELILWLVAGVIGYIVSAFQLFDGFRDAKYLRISGFNGARQAIARGFIRREAVRHSAQTANIILGVIALTYPPGPPPTAKAEMFSILLIYIAASITVNSLLDRRARKHALAELERRGL